jgi:hypothetical protein
MGTWTLPPIGALVVLVLLALGLLALALFEVRRWAQLGNFLTRRQKVLRGTNLVLGGVTLLLVGALSFDALPAQPLSIRLTALTAVVVLLLLVTVLVLWDLREIAARRLDGEMTLWADGARTMLEQAKKQSQKRPGSPR